MGKRLAGLFSGLIVIVYPLIVLSLRDTISSFWLLAILLIALGLRVILGAKGTPTALLLAAIAAMLLSGAMGIVNADLAIRLYPAMMTGTMMIAFFASLIYPPSMIERFARVFEPDLPDEGISYTRQVTMVWCAFLMLNLLISLWTALYSSYQIWSLYNGVVSYALMGLLFVGELFIRKRVRKA